MNHSYLLDNVTKTPYIRSPFPIGKTLTDKVGIQMEVINAKNWKCMCFISSHVLNNNAFAVFFSVSLHSFHLLFFDHMQMQTRAIGNNEIKEKKCYKIEFETQRIAALKFFNIFMFFSFLLEFQYVWIYADAILVMKFHILLHFFQFSIKLRFIFFDFINWQTNYEILEI